MATFGVSGAIQRCALRNPLMASRSGMCSRSYQSWNSSSGAAEKSIAAIRMPFAIVSSPTVCAILLALYQEIDDGARPRDQERHRGGWLGDAALSGRRR